MQPSKSTRLPQDRILPTVCKEFLRIPVRQRCIKRPASIWRTYQETKSHCYSTEEVEPIAHRVQSWKCEVPCSNLERDEVVCEGKSEGRKEPENHQQAVSGHELGVL